MRYRLLGASGLRASEVFLGAMTFGEESGPGASLEECRRMLEAYAEAGGNVVDTAINYRNGESESFVGELLEGRRDRFVVATKYTVSRDRTDPNASGNHRKNLRLSLETSLRRLRTDYIDLYWVHIWDRHTPIEETMRALDDAVGTGKILYVGISDAPAWIVSRTNTLAEWRGWSPFVALQVPYHLLKRDIEVTLADLQFACALGPHLARALLDSRALARDLVSIDEDATGSQVLEDVGEKMTLAAVGQMMECQSRHHRVVRL